MDFEKEFKIFEEYINKNYDMSNNLASLKYIHTLKVVKIMALLSKKMKLDDEDIRLALYIALFHDLGRFEEIKIRKEFNNIKFDHALYSNKVLFERNFIEEFAISDGDYNLIKSAIYYHNKKDLDDSLTEREQLFCRLIRDADRIDIFRVLSENCNNLFDGISSDKLLEQFYKGESIDIKDLETKGDRVLLRFGFVKLFSFTESIETLKETGNFVKYVYSINVNENERELFNKLVNEINGMIEGEKDYVGKKVQSFNG